MAPSGQSPSLCTGLAWTNDGWGPIVNTYLPSSSCISKIPVPALRIRRWWGSWLRYFRTWSQTLRPYKMHGLRPPGSLQYSRTVAGEREREIIRPPPSLLPVVPSLGWWLGRSRRRLCLLQSTRAWRWCRARAETCSSTVAAAVHPPLSKACSNHCLITGKMP
jgi:hypothetical protein